MKSHGKTILGMGLVVLAIGGGVGYRLYAGAAAEADAKDQLEKMGVLVTPDASGHVQGIALLPSSKVDLNLAMPLMGKLPCLEVVRLAGTGVTDKQLVHLSRCKAITSLDLTKTAVGDEGVKHIGALQSLQTLYLTQTQVTAASLAAIGKCGTLKILNLSDTAVEGDLAPLAKLENLQHLVLTGIALDEAALGTLEKMKSLNRLTIRSGQVSEAGLERLLKTHPEIKIDLGELEAVAEEPTEGEEG